MCSCSLLFVTQNRKLLVSSSRMRDFIGRKRENKVCISILNCHPGNNFKTEGNWFVFKCSFISRNFQKNGGVGGRKTSL